MLKIIKGKHLVANFKILLHIHLSVFHFFLRDSQKRINRKVCDPEEDLGIPGHPTKELKAGLHPSGLPLSIDNTVEKSRERGGEEQTMRHMH